MRRRARRGATLLLVPALSGGLVVSVSTPAAAVPARPAAAVSAPAAASVPVGAFAPVTGVRPGSRAFGERVLRVAAAQRGKPYRWGAEGPRAFDCSGFTSYVYKRAVGKKLPRTAGAQRKATRRVSKSQVRPGDLVFVSRRGRVSHVAIYASKGYWWESTRPGRPVSKNKAWSRNVSYGRLR